MALYAAGAFALGGAFAPALHALAAAAGIAPMAFPEFTLRLVQLFALLGLWPLLCVLGLRGAGAWGLASGHPRSSFLGGVLRGFGVGALMMAAVFAVLIAAGARSGAAAPGDLEWLVRLARFLGAAAVVAIIEEVWFRGALHSAFEHIGGVPAALCAAAALYGAVHFIEPGTAAAAVPSAGIGSGFAVLGDAFHRFARAESAGPAAALFVAGLLLGVVRHRTQRVAECIGIHAGWVLVNKAGRTLTMPEPDSPFAWLAAGYDGVIGWAACLLFSLAALWCWCRPVSPRSANDP